MKVTLIQGGYRIDGDSVCVIQDFDPEKPFINGVGQPFDSEADAKAHAESVVAGLEASLAT